MPKVLRIKALKHEQILGGGCRAAPEPGPEVLAGFDAAHDEIVALLSDSRNGALDGTATFFSGPKQTADFPTSEFL